MKPHQYLSYLLLFIIIQCSTHGYSQVDIDSLQAEQFYKTADSLAETGNYSSAIDHYKKASYQFEKIGNYERKVTSNIQEVVYLRTLGKFDDARTNILVVIEECEKRLQESSPVEANAYHELAILEIIAENHDFAVKYNHNALKIRRLHFEEDDPEIANSYNNFAILYFNRGYFDSARHYSKKVLNIRRSKYGNDHTLVASAYNNLGNMLLFLNSHDQAIVYLKQAVRIRKKIFGSGHISLYYPYLNLGTVHKNKGDYDQAISFGKQALNIAKNTFGINHENVAKSLMNNANAHVFANDHKNALKGYKKSLKIYQNIFGYNHTAVALVHRNLGGLYAEKKNYELALVEFMKANSIYMKTFAKTYYHRAYLLVDIAETHHIMGSLDSALYYCERSLGANISNIEGAKMKFAQSKKYFLKALSKKALFNYEKYKKTNEVQFLENSIATLMVCDSAIDVSLQDHTITSDQLFVRQTASTILKNAVTICAENGLMDNENLLLDAFFFSEKEKAAILRNSVSNNSAQNYAQIPQEYLNEEQRIKLDISFVMSKLKNRSGDKEKWNQHLFSLLQSKDSLIKSFEENYPKYHQLKYSTKAATIEQIQNDVLSPNQSLIEYSIADSAIYAFVIDKQNYIVKKLHLDDSLNQRISNIPIYLKNNDFENYSKTAYTLNQQLIEPLGLKNENLIIVPDGILWHLNFDLLLSTAPEQKDFTSLNYLIKKHNISYAYSATLLLQDLNSTIQNKPENECLAFSYGNPNDTTNGDYLAMRTFRNDARNTLPGTQKEVKAIADVLKGDYYFGSFANESNFKENARDYNILHLALHGEVDDQNPMNSKLIFSQSKDSLEDNYLHAFELYNTQLNADLAVLSACNTGDGKIQKGEGIMSLGRAFSYAGCKSLLLSQWELSDVITPKIMKTFYQNLQEGNSKSEALRKAKLTYLENADNISSNPYYWGALIQLGNDEPIYFNNKKWWWIGFAAVLGLAIVVYLSSKKRNEQLV